MSYNKADPMEASIVECMAEHGQVEGVPSEGPTDAALNDIARSRADIVPHEPYTREGYMHRGENPQTLPHARPMNAYPAQQWMAPANANSLHSYNTDTTSVLHHAHPTPMVSQPQQAHKPNAAPILHRAHPTKTKFRPQEARDTNVALALHHAHPTKMESQYQQAFDRSSSLYPTLGAPFAFTFAPSSNNKYRPQQTAGGNGSVYQPQLSLDPPKPYQDLSFWRNQAAPTLQQQSYGNNKFRPTMSQERDDTNAMQPSSNDPMSSQGPIKQATRGTGILMSRGAPRNWTGRGRNGSARLGSTSEAPQDFYSYTPGVAALKYGPLDLPVKTRPDRKRGTGAIEHKLDSDYYESDGDDDDDALDIPAKGASKKQHRTGRKIKDEINYEIDDEALEIPVKGVDKKKKQKRIQQEIQDDIEARMNDSDDLASSYVSFDTYNKLAYGTDNEKTRGDQKYKKKKKNVTFSSTPTTGPAIGDARAQHIAAVVSGEALPRTEVEAQEAARNRHDRLLIAAYPRDWAQRAGNKSGTAFTDSVDFMPEFFSRYNFNKAKQDENVRCMCGAVVDGHVEDEKWVMCGDRDAGGREGCGVWQHVECGGQSAVRAFDQEVAFEQGEEVQDPILYYCHVCDPFEHRHTVARLRRENPL